MHRGICHLLVAAALMLHFGTALAGTGSTAIGDEERARAHFEAGRALYALGNYDQALREFTAGYLLSHRPEFLLNMGQSYRKMGDLAGALRMYREFLEALPAHDPRRAEVEQLLRQVQSEKEAMPPSPPNTLTTPNTEPPSNLVSVVAPISGSSSATPRKSGMRRYWWMLLVGAAVLGGVGVGVYFAVRPPNRVDCSAAGYGCLDARGP